MARLSADSILCANLHAELFANFGRAKVVCMYIYQT
jgi:hypothetical protein